jgi:hypothetical protein
MADSRLAGASAHDRRFTPFLATMFSCLYFAQGLPAGLLRQAMPALMRSNMVPVEYIGLIKTLEVPWLMKLLWAPLVDSRGTRRRWILGMQGVVIPLFFTLSWFEFDQLFDAHVVPFFIVLIAIFVCSATQDVATDGLMIRLLPDRLRGLGNSLQEAGHKLGMICGGGLLLICVGLGGWELTLKGLSLVLLLCTLPIYFYREPASMSRREERAPSRRSPRVIWHYVRDHFVSFVARPGIGAWILVMLTYKLGGSLGLEMINPMLIDRGFDLIEVGSIGTAATIAGILGSFAGGLVYYGMGARRSMLGFGVLQALGIGGYFLVAEGMPSVGTVYAVAVFHQFTDAMANFALFAMMMSHCRPGVEGSDYTTQACLEVSIGGAASALSGFFVKYYGYEVLFLTSAAVGMMTLLPVAYYFRFVYGKHVRPA